MSTVVSVDELRRAWHALEAGQFRAHRPAAPTTGHAPQTWSPNGLVIAVAGVSGHVGASTGALAIATAAAEALGAPAAGPGQNDPSAYADDRTEVGSPDATGGADDGTTVRLIECAPSYRAGTAAASTAELGTGAPGTVEASWRRGRRGPVMIERLTCAPSTVADVPAPAVGHAAVTVVDTGWDITSVTTAGGWLSRIATDHSLLLTTVATAPGLRALEAALGSLTAAHPIWCAVLGPRRRRWPAHLVRACGRATDRAREEGRLLQIPHVEALALAGLTPDPLPKPVVSTLRPLVERVLAERTTTNGVLPCD